MLLNLIFAPVLELICRAVGLLFTVITTVLLQSSLAKYEAEENEYHQ